MDPMSNPYHEIAHREKFGAELGRAWAKIPPLMAAPDFRAFCEMIAQTSVWDEVDFIVLSAAWKAMHP